MDQSTILACLIGFVALGSFYLSPKVRTVEGFFKGYGADGAAPSMWALTLSQVTTWIFARSIVNVVILGFFYGIAGALAYTAYYLSFLTGGRIITSLRFRHGFDNVQDFLNDRFGALGPALYNFVTAVRLISEIFANLLVVGIIFGLIGSPYYITSILAVAGITLLYSLSGGMQASIRTDVFQMILFLIIIAALSVMTGVMGTVDANAILYSSPDLTSPGWVLFLVALLQVWSYPMHDPVMMDRGLIADEQTTKKSFFHAAWISCLCMLIFGLLGVYAGLHKLSGEAYTVTLERLFGFWPMIMFNGALLISAMSTMDSTLSSAAKLAVHDGKLMAPTLLNGRMFMVLFMIAGLLMVFFGSKDLFSAVAVSGTASMFLTPVIFFSLWAGWRHIPSWAYVASFLTALTAAVLYFTESSGYTNLMTPYFDVSHKYSKLLILCIITFVLNCSYFIIAKGMKKA